MSSETHPRTSVTATQHLSCTIDCTVKRARKIEHEQQNRKSRNERNDPQARASQRCWTRRGKSKPPTQEEYPPRRQCTSGTCVHSAYCSPRNERRNRMKLAACFVSASVFALATHAGTMLADVEPRSVASCLACHGPQGQGTPGGVPRLAGQHPTYLEHAMKAFRAGTRSNPVMQSVANGLSDDAIQELSAHFSGLPVLRIVQAPLQDEHLFNAGKSLAESGLKPGRIPACLSCHGAGGSESEKRAPSLRGQPASYLAKRLQDFQAKGRAMVPEQGSMTAVAMSLDQAQIKQVAFYFSSVNAP